MDVKWVFFDVGSTLADETEAFRHCVNDAVRGTGITAEMVYAKSIEFAKQNRPGARDSMIFYKLPRVEWHKEDEFPYPDAEDVLKYTYSKGYKIGIIANQLAGTASRLENWGLLKYIDVVAASAELGMKTIWVRQGLAAYKKPVREEEIPDFTVDDLSGLKEIL